QKDFLHSVYPAVLAAAMSGWQEKKAEDLPKEPYTPTIKSIRFNYTASSTEIIPSSENFGEFNRKEIQLFHMAAFGQAEQHGYLKSETAKLFGPTVPFNKAIFLFPQYVHEGSFCFSLAAALPGQSVSFLFQLAEGTANPEKEAVNIQWYALSNNEWRKLKQTEILKDETNHLLRSGIIRLVIPAEATTDNSLFDAGKIWLCAVVEKDVDAVCLLNDVLTQAVTATFKTEAGITALHESPAGTISKLVNKVAEVKKLNQPYASFGGKAVESSDDFYLRISERLRHKQRSVDLWDYEHLVLQAFPEVYKVKCLNHSLLPADCACDFVKPGNVTLVVVPDVRNKNQFNPLEPKVSLDVITRVEEYLDELCSFFITPQIKNPVYEQVKLQFKVRFRTEGDFGFYADLLNHDLMKYLTPWAYASDIDIVFGGHIRKSVLLNFVEELSYVDFLTEFNLYHVVNGVQGPDTDEIRIINPAAILVSHPKHLITAYQETEVCV
ncbi:MAG TPA: baseplate J/gp47 family protein, partial [Lacibacter sp.]|nr:baseplate J/gp47 family protein [Lacibacter sp.]